MRRVVWCCDVIRLACLCCMRCVLFGVVDLLCFVSGVIVMWAPLRLCVVLLLRF